MGIVDQIAAITNDVEGNKPRRRAALRAQRMGEALVGKLPHTFTRGQFSLTIESATVGETGIKFRCSLTRNGRPVKIDPDQVIVNPPHLVPDPAGDIDLGERGMHRVDAFEAIQTALLDTIRAQLG